jgi:hypothetical protein
MSVLPRVLFWYLAVRICSAERESRSVTTLCDIADVAACCSIVAFVITITLRKS